MVRNGARREKREMLFRISSYFSCVFSNVVFAFFQQQQQHKGSSRRARAESVASARNIVLQFAQHSSSALSVVVNPFRPGREPAWRPSSPRARATTCSRSTARERARARNLCERAQHGSSFRTTQPVCGRESIPPSTWASMETVFRARERATSCSRSIARERARAETAASA